MESLLRAHLGLFPWAAPSDGGGGPDKWPYSPAEWAPLVIGALFCRGTLRVWAGVGQSKSSRVSQEPNYKEMLAFPQVVHTDWVYFFLQSLAIWFLWGKLASFWDTVHFSFFGGGVRKSDNLSWCFTFLLLPLKGSPPTFLVNFWISRQWILVMSITSALFLEFLPSTRCFSWDISFHSAK